MKHLTNLPNLEGFEFIGIDHNGQRVECIVDKNPVGCHEVYIKATRDPCWCRLSGWEPLPFTSTPSQT